MTANFNSSAAIFYKNFNLCPHCLNCCQDPVLGRLCETMPMISRSDGKSFHLLLADRPLPYPVEEKRPARRPVSPLQEKLSVYFWYCITRPRDLTSSCIVILPQVFESGTRLFREIERVADLLAEELFALRPLATMYELSNGSLVELPG